MGCGVKSFIIFALSLSLLLFCGCRERRKTHRNTGNSENSDIRYEHSGGRDTHRHNGGRVIRHAPAPSENSKLYAPGSVHANHRDRKVVVHPVRRTNCQPRIVSGRSGEYIPPSTRKFNNAPVASLDLKPAVGDGFRRRSYHSAVYYSSASEHYHRKPHPHPSRRGGFPPRMHRRGPFRPDRDRAASAPRHRDSAPRSRDQASAR